MSENQNEVPAESPSANTRLCPSRDVDFGVMYSESVLQLTARLQHNAVGGGAGHT